MTARSPSAFLLSAALHALVVGLAILLSYTASRRSEDLPKVFELVAGEGDNYAATEAPALGTPGVKLTVKSRPTPKIEPAPPTPPAVEPEPVPVKPAPTPTKAAPPEQTIPNFTKKIKREMVIAESRAKMQIAKERAAEKKRADEEKKRLSKEEFDRLNKSNAQASSRTKVASAAKVPKIDAEGIAKGVTGGSTKNKTGGAGGKALVANHDNLLGPYFAMFKQRVRDRFELPPGASEVLETEIEFLSHQSGSISNVRVVKSSGNRDFDRAVLDAVHRVVMPPRPDKKTENVTFTFTTREREEP